MAELDNHAKILIQEYIYKIAFPTGIAAVVIAFLVGFLVRDVAQNGAEKSAFEKYSTEATKVVIESADKLRVKALEFELQAAEMLKRADELRTAIETADKKTKNITNIHKSAVVTHEKIQQLHSSAEAGANIEGLVEKVAPIVTVQLKSKLAPKLFQKTVFQKGSYNQPPVPAHCDAGSVPVSCSVLLFPSGAATCGLQIRGNSCIPNRCAAAGNQYWGTRLECLKLQPSQ